MYSYDPRDSSTRLEGRSNKLLMRRYAAVQRARDADVIGILVGTLGVCELQKVILLANLLFSLHSLLPSFVFAFVDLLFLFRDGSLAPLYVPAHHIAREALASVAITGACLID